MRFTLAYPVACLACICFGPAWAQSGGNAAQETDATVLLAAEIDRLERDLDMLAELSAWQSEMLRAARIDPATALRQRRPVSACVATPLAPLCDRLTVLFRTGEGAP